MTKTIGCLLLLAAATAAIADEKDCSVYQIDGLRPGMNLEEAQAGDRVYHEKRDFRSDLGYRRYEWQNVNKAEKVELHVDINPDPHLIVGVMKTVPSTDFEPAAYVASLVERWGPPVEEVARGAFTLFTWHDPECDVSVRLNRMNVPHEVGAWVGVNSISFRKDFARKKKERQEQKENGDVAPEAVAGSGDE